MRRVGLTGNIASGKSAVADVWRGMGVMVVDADELARDAVAFGSPGLTRVVQRFGSAVLTGDGVLDRAALRRIVFSDDGARRDLEAIIHPEVERLRLDAEASAQGEGRDVIVHMIPLLFETGMEERFDVLVLVDAPEPVRLARIMQRRGLPEADARAMIAAQMPSQVKRDRADVVIDNDADMQVLTERAARAWQQVEARLA